MRSNSLWPVLVVLAIWLAGVGAVEWIAAHREADVMVIAVLDGAGADLDLEASIEAPWQASDTTGPEHERARQLLRRGDVVPSLEVYAALAAPADAPTALLTEYAYALRRANRCEDAEALVSRAALRAPNDGAVALASALTLRCLDRTDAARAEFERALDLRPNHHPTRLAFADFLKRAGDLNRAISVLEPASTSGNNNERAAALAELGHCFFLRGDLEQGRAALADAVERAPSAVAIWMSVARTYLGSDESSDHQLALVHAEQATRLAPSVAAPFSVLGRAQEKTGQNLEAIGSYTRAAELDSQYRYPRERLVRLALEEDQNDLAQRSAAQLLELDGTSDEYQFLSGLASARAGDLQAARTAYQGAIGLRAGEYAEAWFNLGLLEREAGDLNAALAAYQRAIGSRPDYDSAWNNMGLVQYDLGLFAEAVSSFRAAIALRPDYSSAWSNLGRAWAAMDNYSEAAAAYESAFAFDPTDRVVRLRLAAAYRRTGRVAESIEVYKELVASEPRYVAAWYNMAIALANSARETEAIAAYQTAISIDPSHFPSHKNLGLLHARLGQNNEAIVHLSTALDLEPANSGVRVRLAAAALATGDKTRCAHGIAIALAAGSASDARALDLQRQCEE